jgi:hypothetical protein
LKGERQIDTERAILRRRHGSDAEIAGDMGISVGGLRSAISRAQHDCAGGLPPEPLESLMIRWRGLIGPMKKKLRAELAEGQT